MLRDKFNKMMKRRFSVGIMVLKGIINSYNYKKIWG